MKRITFLQLGTAILLGTQLFAIHKTKLKRKLCFNTLACPEWSLQQIFENAQRMGYTAVEIRGLLGDVDILQSPYFAADKLGGIKKMANDHTIRILNLNSSAVLHEYETEKRNSNLDTVKKYIDMAQALDCPFVRVFPNKFPAEKTKAFALDTIRENLTILGDYCKGSQVKVLLDTHSDLVWADDIREVMAPLDKQHTGIIWDFFNMHAQTGESPEKMYATLGEFIQLVQLKDGFFNDDRTFSYTQTGEGEVPISKILGVLDKANYDGYISFEWEKRWHPELEGPEIALPHFMETIAKL